MDERLCKLRDRKFLIALAFIFVIIISLSFVLPSIFLKNIIKRAAEESQNNYRTNNINVIEHKSQLRQSNIADLSEKRFACLVDNQKKMIETLNSIEKAVKEKEDEAEKHRPASLELQIMMLQKQILKLNEKINLLEMKRSEKSENKKGDANAE